MEQPQKSGVAGSFVLASSDWITAITNVLARKRSERLGLQTKYNEYVRKKEAPERGLGGEIARLNREIKALEEAIEIARAG